MRSVDDGLFSDRQKRKGIYRYYICNRARKHVCDKQKVEKEKLENFIVYDTMKFLQRDEIIDKLTELLYDLQYEENTVLPRLENQLAEKKKEIGNIVTAIQKGVRVGFSHAATERIGRTEKSP